MLHDRVARHGKNRNVRRLNPGVPRKFREHVADGVKNERLHFGQAGRGLDDFLNTGNDIVAEVTLWIHSPHGIPPPLLSAHFRGQRCRADVQRDTESIVAFIGPANDRADRCRCNDDFITCQRSFRHDDIKIAIDDRAASKTFQAIDLNLAFSAGPLTAAVAPQRQTDRRSRFVKRRSRWNLNRHRRLIRTVRAKTKRVHARIVTLRQSLVKSAHLPKTPHSVQTYSHFDPESRSL